MVSSNGTVAVSNPGTKDVMAFDAVTHEVTARVNLGVQTPRAVTSVPGSPLVYVACGLNQLAVVDGRPSALQELVPVGMYPSALVYSPLSGHIYCTNAGGDGIYPESTVSVIDPSQNRVLKDIVVGPGPSLLSYNDVEGKVYVAGRDRFIRTIDVMTDSVVRETALDSFPTSMVFGSSRNRLFVASRTGTRCGLWVMDGSNDSVAAAYQVSGSSGCTFSSVGWNSDAEKAYLFYGYAGKDTVAVWDAVTDSVTATIQIPRVTYSSAYDPTDSTLYVGSDGYPTLALLDDSADSLVDTLYVHVCAGKEYLCFSPQSNRLYVTGYSSGTVAVLAGRSYKGWIRADKGPVLAHVGSNGIVYVANAASGDLTAFPDTMFVGIEDTRSLDYPTNRLSATVVNRKLLLPTPTLGSAYTYILMDVAGRRLTDLHPGLNDMGGLAPGIYFLKERRADCAGTSVGVRKIVVTH